MTRGRDPVRAGRVSACGRTAARRTAHLALALAAAAALLDPRAASGAYGIACGGDCDGDGRVTIAEIVRAVSGALGNAGRDACPAADWDGDGTITVDELIRAVSMALRGCPPPPSESPTPVVTATGAATATASATASPSSAPTAATSPTAEPSQTAAPTSPAPLTHTVSPTLTRTSSPSPTASQTTVPSASPSSRVTPSAPATATATGFSTPAPSATPTATPSAAATDTAGKDWTFTDVTGASGLDYEHGYVDSMIFDPRFIAGGVAAGDYDNDGDVDLYVVRGDIGPNLLFRNRGDGRFEEVGAAAGVAIVNAAGSGPTFADIDGDGWLDLLVLGVEGTKVTLFRNLGDGTFQDISVQSGLRTNPTLDTYSAAFGDYDRDGDLDLALAHWATALPNGQRPRAVLWRNNGNATFTDVTDPSGLAAVIGGTVGGFPFDLTFTPNFADIDDDGWPDLLLASDFGTSRVLINNRDGTFHNATTPVISDQNGMGGAVGDYDNDGHLDWFVSSIWDPDGVTNGNWGITGNRLYHNRGDGTFEDVTEQAGVRRGYWGWGATFADLDNDGNLDIFHVNGWGPFEKEHAVEFHYDPARLFVANGDGTFAERSAELGADDDGQGRGVVAFDYDGDGDLDLFIANNRGAPHLLRNDGGNRAPALRVHLRGAPPNTGAIGARVYVKTGARTQMRELRVGCNFESQDPVVAHFGLGDAAAVDSVRVVWPDGLETLVEAPAAPELWIDHPALAP